MKQFFPGLVIGAGIAAAGAALPITDARMEARTERRKAIIWRAEMVALHVQASNGRAARKAVDSIRGESEVERVVLDLLSEADALKSPPEDELLPHLRKDAVAHRKALAERAMADVTRYHALKRGEGD